MLRKQRCKSDEYRKTRGHLWKRQFRQDSDGPWRGASGAHRAENRDRDPVFKGSEKIGNLEVLKRMEPELKVFRFEKSDRYFAELSDAEKKDEQINIRNGLNYAKKGTDDRRVRSSGA